MNKINCSSEARRIGLAKRIELIDLREFNDWTPEYHLVEKFIEVIAQVNELTVEIAKINKELGKISSDMSKMHAEIHRY